MLKDIDQSNKKVAELENQVYELRQTVKEKEGLTQIIQEEMRAQKRDTFLKNSKLG